MGRIEMATVGYRKYDDNGTLIDIIGGKTENGYCYKDEEAYKTGEGICYIPEYDLDDLHKDLKEFDSRYENSSMTEDEYRKEREEILLYEYGYTRKNFLDIWGGLEEFADDTFYMVDWQSPETYANEWDVDEECVKELGYTIEDFNKAMGYNYFEV